MSIRRLTQLSLLAVAAAAPPLPVVLAELGVRRRDWSALADTWYLSLEIAGGFALVALAGVLIVGWRRDRAAHPLPFMLFAGGVAVGLMIDASVWGFASLAAYFLFG